MIKVIHLHLVMLMGALLLSLQGCGPAALTPVVKPLDPTAAQAVKVSPTVTPTVKPKDLAGLAPSAAPIEQTQTPASPLLYSGPLTAAQQAVLTWAARGFLAESPELAAGVAKKIGEETAASVDGPLVIAILDQAGLLPTPVNPHQLWMLDPVKNWQLAKKAFPKEDYQWITLRLAFDTRIIANNPLYAGDILYFAGGNGTLADRFFLVTRVDEHGLAYTTASLKTKSGGYVIDERLLYNPVKSQDGLIGEYAKASGDGRLLIWRLRDRRGQSAYQAQLNRVLDRGGKWNVLVKRVGGPVLFERDADALIHPASVIKVPVAMLVMQQLGKDPQGLEQELQTGPAGAGRSFTQLLSASLVKSEEEATGNLESYLFNELGPEKIHAQLAAWGAAHTQVEPRRSTAREMATLFEGLYQKTLLPPQSSQMLLDSLAAVTSGDTARLWRLHSLLPSGAKIYNKRGTLTDPVLIVADAGIISLPDGSAYILCLFGYPEGDGMETYEDLDATIGDFAVAWYRAQFAQSAQP